MSEFPKLRPRLKDLPKLSSRYELSNEIDLFKLKPKIEKQGYLNKSDLQEVAYWKSPRSAGHILKNSDQYIQEISGFALTAIEERTRIEVLRLLNGVSWPTASVVLHFFHEDPYPIIDFRALYSISLDLPSQYTFQFWWEYVVYCRELSTKSELNMRDLDQALWQFSKENQKPI